MWRGHCKHDLTAAAAVCLGSGQGWTYRQTLMDRRGAHGDLSIPVELLTTDGFWEEGQPWPLLCTKWWVHQVQFQWLCPNVWPHSQFEIRGPQNNTTKAKGYGKGTCGEEEGMTGLGEIRKNSGDSKQNQDIHVWACQRTSLINLKVESDDRNQDKWVWSG